MAQEIPAEDSGEIRKKAATRLIGAGVVTAVALGALWWLDSGGKQTKPTPSKAPAPIVSAPTTMPPPRTEPPQEPATTPPPEGTPANQAPPPPEVVAPAGPSAPRAAAGTPGHASATPKTAPPPAPGGAAAQSAKPAPSAARGDEAPSAYVVRLGVFSDPGNARELVERLARAGVQAKMETRVHVGPFPSRIEAELARAEILRLGIKGVVATK